MRLHAEDPQLEEMLPDRWAAAHPEAVLTHRLEESRAKAANKRDRRHRRRVVARHQRLGESSLPPMGRPDAYPY